MRAIRAGIRSCGIVGMFLVMLVSLCTVFSTITIAYTTTNTALYLASYHKAPTPSSTLTMPQHQTSKFYQYSHYT